MVDAWEDRYGLDPMDPTDASQDMDNDGLTNLEEYAANTEPDNPDSDGDGIKDGSDSDPLTPEEKVEKTDILPILIIIGLVGFAIVLFAWSKRRKKGEEEPPEENPDGVTTPETENIGEQTPPMGNNEGEPSPETDASGELDNEQVY